MTELHHIMSTMMIPILSTTLMKSSGDNSNIFYIILIIFMQILMQHGDKLLSYLNTYIKYIPFFKQKNLVYNIIGKISYKNNALWNHDISIQIKAVIYDLLHSLMDDKNGTEYTIEEIYLRGYKKESFQFITLKNNKKYSITPTLFIKTKVDEITSIKEDNKYVTYTITLLSTAYSITDITLYIEKCTSKYIEEKLKQHKYQHIFIFNSIKEDTDELDFIEIPFNTTKSFDNMFFEQKNEVKRRLDYFINNEDIYQRLGIPRTLGFLLHGLPGTGKTSCIKSIAKYTKRHIFIIPVKKITNIDILKKIFHTIEINNINIPNDRRLYVFEEIDCGQWKNVVISRSIKEHNDIDNKYTASASKELLEIVNKLTPKPEQISLKEDITLGDFLELLDGIIEIPGRMMIMTTNHPEILDPSLLRPGRIDMIIEFKKMTKNDIINMYHLWFNLDIPQYILNHIKDYQFTQADIGKIFIKRDLEEIYKNLINNQ